MQKSMLKCEIWHGNGSCDIIEFFCSIAVEWDSKRGQDDELICTGIVMDFGRAPKSGSNMMSLFVLGCVWILDYKHPIVIFDNFL